jgi:hypothetical protein
VTFQCLAMASVDSGVETENDSNDSSSLNGQNNRVSDEPASGASTSAQDSFETPSNHSLSDEPSTSSHDSSSVMDVQAPATLSMETNRAKMDDDELVQVVCHFKQTL